MAGTSPGRSQPHPARGTMVLGSCPGLLSPGSGALWAGSSRCLGPSHLFCRASSCPAGTDSLAGGSSPPYCLHGPCFPNHPGEGCCRTLHQPSPGPATSAPLIPCPAVEAQRSVPSGRAQNPRLPPGSMPRPPDQGLHVPLSSFDALPLFTE